MSGPVVKKTHLIEKTAGNTMQHGELRAYRCSWLVNRTFQLVYEHTLNIGTAGLNAKRLYAMSSKYTK